MVNWKTVVFSTYQILIYKRNHGKKRVRQAIETRNPLTKIWYQKQRILFEAMSVKYPFQKLLNVVLQAKHKTENIEIKILRSVCFIIIMETPFSTSVFKTASNVFRQEVSRSPWNS